MNEVSNWAAPYVEPMEGEYEELSPDAVRIARRLDKMNRWVEAIIAWGWALGWAILFFPCAALVIVALVSGPRDYIALPIIASVLLGIPLFRLIRKGIRILRAPSQF